MVLEKQYRIKRWEENKMLKEMIMKIFIGMVISGIKTEDIVKFIGKLKTDMKIKAESTESSFDDMAVNALLSSEDSIIEGLTIAITMVNQKVAESKNKTDDILWIPVGQKLQDIITFMQKSKV
jgi:flagellar hook-basal body complex protein FliE